MTGDFDIAALYAALDAQRRARGLSWQEAARQVSRQFDRTAPRVSASTLTGLRSRAVVEGDGVLQMLRWLERSPESFVPGMEERGRPLPDAAPHQILRFDTRAIHAALDTQRLARGLTWKQLAEQIGGCAPATLAHLAAGGRTSFPLVARIARWLGRPMASMTRPADR